MVETERTSGNGKTPEDSALFSFQDRGQFLSALVGGGLTVAEFALEHESLESLFMRIGARETS